MLFIVYFLCSFCIVSHKSTKKTPECTHVSFIKISRILIIPPISVAKAASHPVPLAYRSRHFAAQGFILLPAAFHRFVLRNPLFVRWVQLVVQKESLPIVMRYNGFVRSIKGIEFRHETVEPAVEQQGGQVIIKRSMAARFLPTDAFEEVHGTLSPTGRIAEITIQTIRRQKQMGVGRIQQQPCGSVELGVTEQVLAHRSLDGKDIGAQSGKRASGGPSS